MKSGSPKPLIMMSLVLSFLSTIVGALCVVAWVVCPSVIVSDICDGFHILGVAAFPLGSFVWCCFSLLLLLVVQSCSSSSGRCCGRCGSFPLLWRCFLVPPFGWCCSHRILFRGVAAFLPRCCLAFSFFGLCGVAFLQLLGVALLSPLSCGWCWLNLIG